MKPMSKSQQRRFKVQKDPKKKARGTQRHKSAVKYSRKNNKDALNELENSNNKQA